ncbi:MAG TPA: rhodanese-like domain-containing protein [Myxococcales bacterium]|jgi:rhodanese-related sulfurtransferase|nr:rhodanese-like domain-containing protein [Myxococcales bacterium]
MSSPESLEIAPQQLAEKLQSGEPVFLLDVRHEWEHQLARLPDQALIPLHELPARLEELESNVPIVCYCHHGVRSLSAAAILRQAGFEGAVSLAGGIDLWSRLIDPSIPRY